MMVMNQVTMIFILLYYAGLLGVGFEKYGDTEALESDPIQHLFDVRYWF